MGMGEMSFWTDGFTDFVSVGIVSLKVAFL